MLSRKEKALLPKEIMVLVGRSLVDKVKLQGCCNVLPWPRLKFKKYLLLFYSKCSVKAVTDDFHVKVHFHTASCEFGWSAARALHAHTALHGGHPTLKVLVI